MMSDHLNATGLTAEESRKLSTRSEREDEKTIIRCLKELYSCKPSEKSYEMYAENATFHDPLVSFPSPILEAGNRPHQIHIHGSP
ncbi:hypothetical protein PTTG_26911 [Puccinia triticina 1-1 BBBD Race 1]|uniref:Uncharacterized protein n=1 Tax=Puccinia triticina (isolate 1-1 / race 1 (BBBD)) TaxID=630390 RepID=A0A180GQ88_PUCT1|nr:hypothetical protein PTTG_26911 [Puccinia triticina 1-1 BBBD Race 1]